MPQAAPRAVTLDSGQVTVSVYGVIADKFPEDFTFPVGQAFQLRQVESLTVIRQQALVDYQLAFFVRHFAPFFDFFAAPFFGLPDSFFGLGVSSGNSQ
jgi:hypothetical protein